jgi:cytochrome d ubiquinol oxidase subunit I
MPFNAIAFLAEGSDQLHRADPGRALAAGHSLVRRHRAFGEGDRGQERGPHPQRHHLCARWKAAGHPTDAQAKADFEAHKADLGFGFLVQRYSPELQDVTEEQIKQASRPTIPPVAPIFWSFRLMVLCGLLMLAYFVLAMIYSIRNNIHKKTWLLKLAPWMIPVPFLACEFGWLVAELGRQPWTLYEVLPTWMSASTHSVSYLVFSLIGFVTVYTIFIIIEMYLMVRAVKEGPGHDIPSDSLLPSSCPATPHWPSQASRRPDPWKSICSSKSSGGSCWACCSWVWA